MILVLKIFSINMMKHAKKYIDGKVDRAMFKETYFHEIKNITSSQDLSSYYNIEATKYTSTLRVRDEWITE